MNSYKELLVKQKALADQITAAREAEVGKAVAEARSIVAEFGLGEADLFGRSISRKPILAKTNTVPAKYQDPETAKTWSGRGKEPLWIAGKDRTAFEIK